MRGVEREGEKEGRKRRGRTEGQKRKKRIGKMAQLLKVSIKPDYLS